MEFTIGMICGLIIGALGVAMQKQARFLRKLPEEDMVREIKRRRFEAALERDKAQEVERELNGPTNAPPLSPRKD
jgi:hypothetical protein